MTNILNNLMILFEAKKNGSCLTCRDSVSKDYYDSVSGKIILYPAFKSENLIVWINNQKNADRYTILN